VFILARVRPSGSLLANLIDADASFLRSQRPELAAPKSLVARHDSSAADVGDFLRLVLRSGLVLPDAFVDLFTVNRHMPRGGDSHAHLSPLTASTGDLNVGSDEQPLADSTRQN